jgi:hypothetical protein
MNTYISTHEYMFQASLMFNKKLSECTDQELEQIRKKVIKARADKAGLVTDTMRQKYGRDWNY